MARVPTSRAGSTTTRKRGLGEFIRTGRSCRPGPVAGAGGRLADSESYAASASGSSSRPSSSRSDAARWPSNSTVVSALSLKLQPDARSASRPASARLWGPSRLALRIRGDARSPDNPVRCVDSEVCEQRCGLLGGGEREQRGRGHRSPSAVIECLRRRSHQQPLDADRSATRAGAGTHQDALPSPRAKQDANRAGCVRCRCSSRS